MGSIWIALQITLVGMGLVFGAIILLWISIALLVKYTTDKTPPRNETGFNATRTVMDRALKQQAAAAAVALALAMRKQPKDEGVLHEFPLPPTAIVSAWQAVMRTNILNKRGRIR